MAANVFQNPLRFARTAIGQLDLSLVLGSTVWRDFEAEFNGAVGYTVNARVPARVTATRYEDAFEEHTHALVKGAITEAVVPISLDTMPYHIAPLTDEELTLKIDDFESRVILPQAIAVAQDVESYLAEKMGAADYAHTVTLSEADPWEAIVQARKHLNAENVPSGDRFLALGSDAEAAILSDKDLVVRVDASGTDQGLREGVIGRLGGFTLVSSNALEADEAFAYHRTAYVLATRAPVVPRGAAAGASTSYGGYSLRWIADYDADYAQDRSFVSTFVGGTAIEDGGNVKRAVKLTLGS